RRVPRRRLDARLRAVPPVPLDARRRARRGAPLRRREAAGARARHLLAVRPGGRPGGVAPVRRPGARPRRARLSARLPAPPPGRNGRGVAATLAPARSPGGLREPAEAVGRQREAPLHGLAA